MRKMVKAVVAGAILTTTLAAGQIFDLSAQRFSNAVAKKYKLSTYDLTNTEVTTQLYYDEGGKYYTDGAVGSFDVDIKAPSASWTVHFSKGVNTADKVTFIAEDGQTLRLTYGGGVRIFTDGKDYTNSGRGGLNYLGAAQGGQEDTTVKVTNEGILVEANSVSSLVKKSNFKLKKIVFSLDKKNYINNLSINTN